MLPTPGESDHVLTQIFGSGTILIDTPTPSRRKGQITDVVGGILFWH